MKTKGFKKTKVWTIVFSLIFTLALSTAEAQQKFKIAGKVTFSNTDWKTIAVNDEEEHNLILNKWEGKNISTGETKFMNNSRAINFVFTDVTKGNGHQQGYFTIDQDGDAIVAKWEGKMITKPSGEGNPAASFEGKMWWVKATGKYKNMHGVATYKGHFNPDNTLSAEWEGEYFKKANRQANK